MQIALDAREEAKHAKDALTAHEQLCALRYQGIEKSISTILSWLRWGGSLAVLTIIGLLAWSLRQQYESAMQARALDARTQKEMQGATPGGGN